MLYLKKQPWKGEEKKNKGQTPKSKQTNNPKDVSQEEREALKT